ncbi:MAG: CoA transferase [Acidobacteria bacterium]|nr:CoA transferase [Acidobacteriota bacterium]
MPAGPLQGIVVLDLSRILSGPFCTMTLGDLGATVFKVEEPGRGDETRHWGPPFLGGVGTYFLSINRNKKGITLNLKSEKGRALLLRAVRQADVLVENFRPGTLNRLGLGYEVLSSLNPRLIVCSISGYGQAGPRSSEPGFDLITQAESGVMSVSGFPEGPPTKMGISIADIATGMWASQGILAALYQRERMGSGQWLDVPLLDSMLSTLTYQVGIYFATGQEPVRMGNRHPSIVPYEAFEAADDYVMIGAGTEGQWRKLCELLGHPELSGDPRFATNADRVRNYTALKDTLAPLVQFRTADAWVQLLREAAIPCGRVRSVSQALSDPQVQYRGLILEAAHPRWGEVRTVGLPLRSSLPIGGAAAPPPELGEHNREFYGDCLGLSPSEIDQLRAEGVI